MENLEDVKNKIDDIIEYMDKRDYDVVSQDLPALSKELEELIKSEVNVEAVVSQENGGQKLEIFDKLLNDLTKGKMFSGKYYWLTSASRIFGIAKKFISSKRLRELHNKYDSRFNG